MSQRSETLRVLQPPVAHHCGRAHSAPVIACRRRSWNSRPPGGLLVYDMDLCSRGHRVLPTQPGPRIKTEIVVSGRGGSLAMAVRPCPFVPGASASCRFCQAACRGLGRIELGGTSAAGDQYQIALGLMMGREDTTGVPGGVPTWSRPTERDLWPKRAEAVDMRPEKCRRGRSGRDIRWGDTRAPTGPSHG